MSKSILAIDDSNSVRNIVEFALKSRGYNVTSAIDGQAALKLIEDSQFDLVVLDIHMPILDGLSLLQIVRDRPDGAALPILVLTTEGQEADRDRALALGATDYLVKPFKPTELLERAEKLLG